MNEILYIEPLHSKGRDAMGFTFYMNNLLRVVKPPRAKKRIFVPIEESRIHAQDWRQKGWVTVQGLHQVQDNNQEAIRLGCDYYAHQGMLREINYDDQAEKSTDFVDEEQQQANKKTVIYKPSKG